MHTAKRIARMIPIIELEACKCGLEIVCSKSIVSECVCKNDDDGEDDSEPSHAESVFHVIGRSAVAGSVIVSSLVDLGKCGFDK